MTRIIVGVDGSTRSEDAVALARGIAATSGDGITLACAYPYEAHASRATSGAYRDALRDDAETTLARMKQGLQGIEDVRTTAIADVSPARALQELAEHEGPALLVIGSSHRGALGRVLAGTTAERLLHGAPCAVAVAPHGFDTRAGDATRTIAVAHDGSVEADAALSAAVAAAVALGAALCIVRVVPAIRYVTPGLAVGAGAILAPDDLRQYAQEALDATVAAVADRIIAEPVLRTGEPASELVEASRAADLLVLGSRAYGPLGAVLLGSVSGRVVRAAECPVIVIPRGAESTLEPLFGDAVTAVAG